VDLPCLLGFRMVCRADCRGAVPPVNVVDGPLTTLLGGERPIGYVAVRGGWAIGHVCGPGRRPRGAARKGALSQEARHSGQASGADPAHDTPGMANL
jgi:hypothetical protein